MNLPTLKRFAQKLGFYHIARIAPAIPPDILQHYDDFIAQNRHGTMGWLAQNRPARQDPNHLWQGVKDIIILTHPYPFLPDKKSHDKLSGRVANYARGMDYHPLLKAKMKKIEGWLLQKNIRARGIVDSAPFFEKPMAMRAGIGWQGKHTNLLTRDLGNWFFLAELLLDRTLDDADDNLWSLKKTSAKCGQCQACITACPTKAITAPYQLDARACISYLTIEHKGAIPQEYRYPLDDMIFGCDICLAVCPFNKFAQSSRQIKQDKKLQGAQFLDIIKLLQMDEDDFQKTFHHSPIKRLGHGRLVRNGLMVLANYGRAGKIKPMERKKILPLLQKYQADDDAVLREASDWVFAHIGVGDKNSC